MTTRSKRSAKSSGIEAVIGQDGEMLRRLMQEAFQQVLEAEMTEAVGAAPGERTAGRLGYRAGYYNRGLVTRIGKLELRVPRDRDGRFSTELFARYQRSEKALVSALAEMYVQGVSTRKVKAITEELCGHTFSASTISRINASLDGVLSRFAERRLDERRRYEDVAARQRERVRFVARERRYLEAVGPVPHAGGQRRGNVIQHRLHGRVNRPAGILAHHRRHVAADRLLGADHFVLAAGGRGPHPLRVAELLARHAPDHVCAAPRHVKSVARAFNGRPSLTACSNLSQN